MSNCLKDLQNPRVLVDLECGDVVVTSGKQKMRLRADKGPYTGFACPLPRGNGRSIRIPGFDVELREDFLLSRGATIVEETTR